ncbi:MAG TPA: hypothetical protein VMZ92_16830 [Planctomycetota bacterium]|nr:hypothetical protein [Planctomycetota bacterium]
MSTEEDLAAIALPGRYVAIVAAAVEDMLSAQDEDGCFGSWKGAKPFHPSSQTPLWPLGFLWRTEHPHNPFAGDARLLEAAIRSGDFLASQSDEQGRFRYDQRGYQIHHVDQWLCYAWLETLLLLEEELGSERSARWRRQLHAAAGYVAESIREWNALGGPFHTRSFGTSPNHAVTRAAFIYRAGMTLDEPAWCTTADAFVSRFLKLQDADGCWPEYEGPVIAYAQVSLAGVAEYAEWSGNAEARAAVERTVPFMARTYYPDGGPIPLFDGRQQHTSSSPWAHFAMSRTPEGRALCDVLSRALCRGSRYGIGGHYRLVENYVHYHAGPVGRLPMDDDTFTHRFHRTAGVRKAHAWMWALSGIVTPSFDTVPWAMERQSLLSLYHTSAGRILSGANCKQHPEAATFVSASTRPDHLPRSTSLDDDVTHVDAVYDTFQAMLTVEVVDEQTFQIDARVVGVDGDQRVCFHLQPAVHHGGTVRLNGEERSLGDEDWEVSGVRTLAWDAVSLDFDAPARVWWPFRGYNPYAADHTYEDLSSARLIVEFFMTSGDACRRVKVTVSSPGRPGGESR